MKTRFLFILYIGVLFITGSHVHADRVFLVGAGKTDITSPIVEVSTPLTENKSNVLLIKNLDRVYIY